MKDYKLGDYIYNFVVSIMVFILWYEIFNDWIVPVIVFLTGLLLNKLSDCIFEYFKKRHFQRMSKRLSEQHIHTARDVAEETSNLINEAEQLSPGEQGARAGEQLRNHLLNDPQALDQGKLLKMNKSFMQSLNKGTAISRSYKPEPTPISEQSSEEPT